MDEPETAESIKQVRSARLHRTMQAVAVAHPFYRSVLADAGLTADDFRSIDGLEKLPLTSKQDYISDPQAFRLDEDALPDDFGLEERVIWDIAYTSGTTGGKPSPFYNTTHDIYGILDQARRCNDAEGLVATDVIANLYPVAAFPTGAFLSVIRSGMIGGQPVVYGMTGSANSDFKVRNSTAEAIEKIEPARPTVLWGVPSFIRRFVADACARGADFSDVRLVVTSGEPVSENLRNELRTNLQAMGADNIGFRARYAFTEMQGGLVQCADDAAPQNITPDLYFLETVNPDTGKRVPYGQEGHMAITHLHRRGTVILRYIVGDVVTLSLDPCPVSGRLGERVVVTPRRTGNLVKCRGMLVNTDVVLDYLGAIEGVGDVQIEFRRDDAPGAMDEMILRLELDGDDRTREKISTDIRTAVSMRPDLQFVDRGTLYDQAKSIKLRRIIDSRPPAD
jgi:phenylacetate-coenzyme A ligase PaaK-like adenylate-forming protein